MAVFIPLERRVIVKPTPKEKETKSGILLREDLQKQKGEGTVLAVGAKVEQIAVGDKVLFSPLYYDEIDKEHFVIDERDVWAIVH